MARVEPHVHQGGGEGDVLASFRAAAEAATDAMLAAVEREPDRVWDPRDLREVAGGGSAASYALCRLANPEYDGRLALTNDLKVRKARPRVDEDNGKGGGSWRA